MKIRKPTDSEQITIAMMVVLVFSTAIIVLVMADSYYKTKYEGHKPAKFMGD